MDIGFWFAFIGCIVLGLIVGAIVGLAVPFLFGMVASAMSHDPSAGGAFVALAMITMPLFGIIGAIVGPIVLWSVW